MKKTHLPSEPFKNTAAGSRISFAELPWKSRFLDAFPVDAERRNFPRTVRNVVASEVRPTPVSAPRLLAWSEPLGDALGIERPAPSSPALAMLAGNLVTEGMRPYSARYGGHQFGHWAGQLGDGRAITLGEAECAPAGGEAQGGRPRSFEFQLKGAGPTPYSRTADGRAVLRSSLREFLCSEAMHFLGVPTTRALSLVATGESVVRDMLYDGNARPEPGAVVCRVAPSFLRFGHFEILAAQRETKLLASLADWLITHHFPDIDAGSPEAYGTLLDSVAKRTAVLMSEWMRVGFVHGVMNTDNMSALGLTIDYGPYGWLEPYEPGWTPNTTDAAGRRYRFGTQPQVALWNLARLAEAFLPLLPNAARAQESLTLYMETFGSAYDAVLARKLGLSKISDEHDEALVRDLLELLEVSRADFTLFFRALCSWPTASDQQPVPFLTHFATTFYDDAKHAKAREESWNAWFVRYQTRVQQAKGEEDSALTPAVRSKMMRAANPKYVLRNFLAQEAITAAEQGDVVPLERLLRVLQTPYETQSDAEDLAVKRPAWAENKPGCSALSCSS
ncbi:MAG: YdiU family protein [Silvanigrellales bacterium]|nr:YdiU family protein [Silvanigrellales bacterium]